MSRLFVKILFLFLASVGLGLAQCPSQSLSPSSPQINCVDQLFYNGSSQLIYDCAAGAQQPQFTWYKSSATLTNIVVTTNSGVITFGSTSYLWVGARITVAGSATTALNDTYKVTAVSGSTATITTVGVADGTYADAGLRISTTAPRLDAQVWAIQVLTYAATLLSGTYWAGPPTSTVPHGLKCSDRALY